MSSYSEQPVKAPGRNMARHRVPGIMRIRLRTGDSGETFSHKGIPPISLVCTRTGIRPS